MSKNKNVAEIDYKLEPYHRKWSNTGFHTISNRIGGAFGWTKKEWNRMIEARNRAKKALKNKIKQGK